MDTQAYLHLFQNLNVNKTGANMGPHKPILLLSIMDLVESGQIESPFIPLPCQAESQGSADPEVL